MTPTAHHRHSPRCSAMDYAARGWWFVTACTIGKRPLLGRVLEAGVELSPLGKLLRDEWLRTPFLRPDVELDEFVIMPTHLHAIVRLVECRDARPSSLSNVLGGVKAAVTVRANTADGCAGRRLWHRSFHDRLLRNSVALEDARRYIRENPVRAWERMLPRSIHTRGRPAMSEGEDRP